MTIVLSNINYLINLFFKHHHICSQYYHLITVYGIFFFKHHHFYSQYHQILTAKYIFFQAPPHTNQSQSLVPTAQLGQIHMFRDRGEPTLVSHWFCHLEVLNDKFSLHDSRERVSIVQEAAIFKMAAAAIFDFFFFFNSPRSKLFLMFFWAIEPIYVHIYMI